MTDPVFRCPDHGFVTRSECPERERANETVLTGERRRRLSKFVSGALRHFPDDAGLALDDAGWTDYDDLAEAVARKYDWAERDHLDAVVAADPKGRFERRESGGRERVRAAYGHSVEVSLEADEDVTNVPDRLYHGTDPANLSSIRAEGLKPMGRQAVHLSETREEAREVGRRHAENPVVLEVDASALLADGMEVTKRGEATYLCDAVPPEYLDVVKG